MNETKQDLTVATVAKDTSISPETLEIVLVQGDLAKLKPEQRVAYYRAVCESVGLNPLTRPFDYINLQNKLTLYARRDCTDQLRKLHDVSITIPSREMVGEMYVVTARATMPSGRQDESLGILSLEKLIGESRANAMMKAETKAKRRVTLSICGLGMLDVTEVEATPEARVVTVDPESGEVLNGDTLVVGRKARTIEATPTPEVATQPTPPATPEPPPQSQAEPPVEPSAPPPAVPEPPPPQPPAMTAEQGNQLMNRLKGIIGGPSTTARGYINDFYRGWYGMDEGAKVPNAIVTWVEPLNHLSKILEINPKASEQKRAREWAMLARAKRAVAPAKSPLQEIYGSVWGAETLALADDVMKKNGLSLADFREWVETGLKLTPYPEADAAAFFRLALVTRQAFKVLNVAKDQNTTVAEIVGQVLAQGQEPKAVDAVLEGLSRKPVATDDDLPF